MFLKSYFDIKLSLLGKKLCLFHSTLLNEAQSQMITLDQILIPIQTRIIKPVVRYLITFLDPDR